MADSDDPFLPPDATRLRPRPGAGQAQRVDRMRPPRRAAPASAEAEPIPDVGARAARHRARTRSCRRRARCCC